MQSNTYLITIIFTFLVGGGTSYLSYIHNKEIHKQLDRNASQVLVVEAKEKELKERQARLQRLTEETVLIRQEARLVSLKLLDSEEEMRRLGLQKEWFDDHLKFQKDKASMLSFQTGEIQDEVQDEVANVERVHKEVDTYYEKMGGFIGDKGTALNVKEVNATKEFEFRRSELESHLKELELMINRKHQVVYNRFENPISLGKVIEREGDKVILDLGAKDGLKQNFKFLVFGRSANGDLIRKGFVIVKRVEELYSSCSLLYRESRDSEVVVSGDYVGTPCYRKRSRVFYLAGDFEKYPNKEDLAEALRYMGNKVYTEIKDLGPEVDLVVEGKYAEVIVADAAQMGISIIREADIVPYLGD